MRRPPTVQPTAMQSSVSPASCARGGSQLRQCDVLQPSLLALPSERPHHAEESDRNRLLSVRGCGRRQSRETGPCRDRIVRGSQVRTKLWRFRSRGRKDHSHSTGSHAKAIEPTGTPACGVHATAQKAVLPGQASRAVAANDCPLLPPRGKPFAGSSPPAGDFGLVVRPQIRITLAPVALFD